MTDATEAEVRAAAGRVRRAQAGEVWSAVWPPDRTPGERTDYETVARAYLVEHPADDAEPVTVEWLRAEGWDEDATAIRRGYLRWSKVSPGWWHGPHPLAWRGTVTRGHVRRLLAALGFSEPTTGPTR